MRPRISGIAARAAIRKAGLFLTAASVLSACGGSGGVKKSPLSLLGLGQAARTGYVGTIVADEPIAALAAHDVLLRGGNAADAAAALGLALSVTLPSRASLGGGGACLAWKPGDRDGGRAFLFLPTGDAPQDAQQTSASRADRPASAPMLARGLYLMQIRYGSVDFADLTRPAISLARAGFEVSGQLAADLSVVQAPLLADDGARAIFGRADGSVLKAGDILRQPRLAGSLERIRSGGVGDLYTGALGQTLVAASNAAGGGLTMAGLRSALPVSVAPLTVTSGNVSVSFLPPPADGGYGAAVAWLGLANGQGSSSRGRQAVAAWRASEAGSSVSTQSARAEALLSSGHAPASGGTLPSLPASTSFAVVDRDGESVACALTMNNLFGTGRMAGSTGIVLGASAAHKPGPLLAAAIAHRRADVFLAASAASGQADAADAAAAALTGALGGNVKAMSPTTEAGRANAISCPGGLPGEGERCRGWTDPRGGGYVSASDGS
ncbi:gamma-glutamyltransferase [Acetobacter sp. DsW_063]|uniref:gamma-glutamyltransferase n=1 Tax=Acetobacter sp. DsW_063 TaxID=1514894 RepID=UPI001E45103B|nr:gamma-glutamyltransferase [Acetobacter sp. DsW_063]